LNAAAESFDHVFTVRGRPVGFRSTRWGGELHAVERGYFPVSSTGFYSANSSGQGRRGPESLPAEFLESLAVAQDRERQALLKQLRENAKAQRDPLMNYIHVSLCAEHAFADGFFAPEAERAALWPAAHRLFLLMESDPRYQPKPGGRWTEALCAQALVKARTMKGLVERCATGRFPQRSEVPVGCFAMRAYLALPAKKTEERRVILTGVNAELTLNLVGMENQTRSASSQRPSEKAGTSTVASTQLSLFGEQASLTPGSGPGL
jgi:hypothetical protein